MSAIPRCRHGAIILGCPHDDCEDQNAYLTENDKAMDRYEEGLRQAVRDYFDEFTKAVRERAMERKAKRETNDE